MTFFAASLPVASLLSSFLASNLAGKAIVLILLVASVVAWSLILAKWMDIQRTMEATRAFLLAYRNEAHPVALFLKRQRYEPSPLYAIYEKSCRALGAALEGRSSDSEDLFMGAVSSTNQKLSEVQSTGVRNAAERTRGAQIVILEENMGFVALATTLTPLLGLLGTLWVAMDGLESLPLDSPDLLSLVVPVVSGALLPAVVGLLVAIPSGIGYSLLTDRTRRLCVQMEEFSQELLTNVEVHYLHQK
jgi:biopolymer transport protein TolQ